MSDYLSDSPAAVDALIGALDDQAGKGTSETPPAPVEAPKADEGTPMPGAESSQTPAGITEPKPQDGKAIPPVQPTQSPFPKELEPHKSLFEKKKWDPTKPEWQGQALQTLTEQEQMIGRHSTDLGLTRTQAAELSTFILGTPQEINAYRERMGATPLAFDSTSLDDKLKSVEGEWTLWQQALSQDEKVSAEAIRAITQKLQGRMEDLRLDKKVEAKSKSPSAQGSNRQAERNLNWSRILEKDPEANKAMSALVPFLKSQAGNGILGSFGMDVKNVMDSPERAAQIHDLAKRVYLGTPEVFEAEVTKRVKAEMEQHRQRQVAGDIPGGVPAAATQHTSDPVHEHLSGIRA